MNLILGTTFSGKQKGSSVQLVWSTATEKNNHGFDIEKAMMNYELGIKNWTKVGFVNGAGNTASPKSYSFIDKNVSSLSAKQILYRLVMIDNDGQRQTSNELTIDFAQIPLTCALFQNYPNPFNPTTTISYQLSTDSYTTLKVFDELGKEVATLVDGNVAAGNYSVKFDASQLSSGIYFYHLKSGTKDFTKKMLLLK